MQASSRHRILIVDDSVDNADSLGIVLQYCGHQVRVVYSAEAALKIIDDFAPDVAVIDILMPVKDGCQLAELMRHHPKTSDSVLIAFTGVDTAACRRSVFRAGFDHYVVKPSTLEDFLNGSLFFRRALSMSE
jgi:CheY-like chemotaxis protein